MLNELFLLIITIDFSIDAEIISKQQGNQNKKETEDITRENHNQQSGPVRFIKLAEEDDLDFDVNMLSVHGENVDPEMISQILLHAGYKLYDTIQDSEKRSMILVMSTSTHRGYFNIAEIVYCLR